ncbi:hypothetical protein K435DRAFT_796258 [Dendrothele bispora CBS 962.96]|uniref:Uncharacterized protein n=1 Tax=Dendrothele bispora (strain CBS 962.96) TaxID=1314807 RepID=A0A4V4HG80_DENBC|nr:hypothetical protein K435DRAFT_796258 [Dendrothele bispora CBS 962.96]
MSGLQQSADDFRRRGSLPTDTLSRSDSVKTRDIQDRSFLSLDLAETQSFKSVKRTEDIRTSDLSKSPQQSPLRLRSSRDSLRTIPSPKPIPSVILPQVPSSPPRLVSITNTAPTFKFPLSSSPSNKSPKSFMPTTTVAGPSTVPKIIAPVATAPFSVPPQRSNSTATWKSSSTVSTRYRRTRRSDALARLEGRTRGPVAYKKRFSVGSKKNFMSMSDDEEEQEDEGDVDGDDEYGFGSGESSDDGFVDLPIDFSSSFVSPRTSLHGGRALSLFPDDDEDVVIPRSPALGGHHQNHHHHHHHHHHHRRFFSWGKTSSVRSKRSQSQSVVSRFPTVTANTSMTDAAAAVAPGRYVKSSSASPPSQRRRRSRTVTMFPLTSFIDLKGDAVGSKENVPVVDEEWGWRSFIEISSLS